MQNTEYELHEHHFTSGPRASAHYDKSGKWAGTTFAHSHPGGGIPHRHPETGPSFYGYRKPKTTSKPKGEQFELIVLSDEESSFDLVITDSAITYEGTGKNAKAVPIGDTPIEQIFMPAADAVMRGSRLKCIVRDERKKKA